MTRGRAAAFLGFLFVAAATAGALCCSTGGGTRPDGGGGTGGGGAGTGGSGSGGTGTGGGGGGSGSGSGGSGSGGSAAGGSGGGGSGTGGAVTDAGPPADAATSAQRWIIDNTTSINGLVPQVMGSPTVTTTPVGTALCFDGDDAIILPGHPLQGLAAFTLEVLLRVDGVPAGPLNQPRFLHIETDTASRATMEARVTETTWYLDTFLLSGAQSLTLVDAARTHPVGAWSWAALSYDGTTMRHYVNGTEDDSGAVAIPPFGTGRMSLGVRQNLVNWFDGCIRELRVSPAALAPAALQRP